MLKSACDDHASDRWYVDNALAAVWPVELQESIDFTFTYGALGRMLREEILTRVVIHGGYHRGVIGRILARVSITPSRDLFTGYLNGADPTARRRVAERDERSYARPGPLLRRGRARLDRLGCQSSCATHRL
jgi:hypothetical protein